MPTTVTEYDEAHQAGQVARYRALADTVLVAELFTPAGGFEVRRGPGGYTLTGAGRRLFGITDPFAADTGLTAANDADAVGSAKRLILERWRAEAEQMSAEFFPVVGQPYEEWANGGGPNECGHGIAAGLPCTPCGGISGSRADTAAEAAALA